MTSVLSSGLSADSCRVRSAWRCLSVTVTSLLSSGSSAASCRVRRASRCLSVCHCDVCPVGRFMSRKERLEMSVCHCDVCPVVRFVGRFMSRKERLEMLGDKAKKFTKVCIKNFAEGLDEQKLRDIFEDYGKIVSVKVRRWRRPRGRGAETVTFTCRRAGSIP